MSGRRRSAAGPASGFILLEAIVGLVLLSAMLALLAQGVALGRRVVEAGERRDRLAQAALGLDALSAWIAAALPHPSGGPGSGILFDGGPDRLTFVTVSNGDVLPGGLVLVSLAPTERRARGARSALRAAPLPLPGGAAIAAQAGEDLSFTQRPLQFSYFGASEPGAPAGWHAAWNARDRLPRLVAVRAEVDLGQRVQGIELVVRIATGRSERDAEQD